MSLIEMAQDVGVTIDEEQEKKLLNHLDLVIKKNEVMNLTRITNRSEGIILHVLDSLTFVPLVSKTSGKVLDIGTGAGFPGIPLAIATGRDVFCIDSVGKKTDAVSSFARDLGVDNCKAEHIRAEELARREGQSFGCVVARAVDKLSSLVEYASPLLCDGGRLVVSKGNLTDEEYEACEKASEICGMRILERTAFELPQKMGHRELIVVERSQKPSIALPRQNGKAHRVPLGY